MRKVICKHRKICGTRCYHSDPHELRDSCSTPCGYTFKADTPNECEEFKPMPGKLRSAYFDLEEMYEKLEELTSSLGDNLNAENMVDLKYAASHLYALLQRVNHPTLKQLGLFREKQGQLVDQETNKRGEYVSKR